MTEIIESPEVIDSPEPEAQRIRLTIPPDQCEFIEQQANDRKIAFKDMVYELIRDRIEQLTKPTPDPVEVVSEDMKRVEAYLVEIKTLLQQHDRKSDDDSEEDDEGNLARSMTAILQSHLRPPLHRVVGQIETFQSEVRAADQSELDRWFIVKAELEVLRDLISQVALAATPLDHRVKLVEHIAFVKERFKHLESRLPPLPDYFLWSHSDS